MTNDSTSSREVILDKIRKGKPRLVPLPAVPLFPYPGDLAEEFNKHLLSFDGKCLTFATREDAVAWMNGQVNTSKIVFSSVPECESTFAIAELKDPHDAHKIDICIAEGVIGVAETGSIWVNNVSLGLAAAALFSTDLYLFLDKASLKSGLHEAYAALDIREHQYGSFYTGPSATADIEAIHVTGAQGEISLTVLLYGD